MSKIEELCKKDNTLQRQVMHGKISRKEYDTKRIAIHTEYTNTIHERELIDKIIAKHRPNKQIIKVKTNKEWDISLNALIKDDPEIRRW